MNGHFILKKKKKTHAQEIQNPIFFFFYKTKTGRKKKKKRITPYKNIKPKLILKNKIKTNRTSNKKN